MSIAILATSYLMIVFLLVRFVHIIHQKEEEILGGEDISGNGTKHEVTGNSHVAA